MSLLNTKTGYTTPWHCSVAQMADGEWISSTMSEFQKDPKLEVVYEDGRPSYFRERIHVPVECEIPISYQPTPEEVVKGRSVSLASNAEVATAAQVAMVEEKLQQLLLTPGTLTPGTTPLTTPLNESEDERVMKLVRVPLLAGQESR